MEACCLLIEKIDILLFGNSLCHAEEGLAGKAESLNEVRNILMKNLRKYEWHNSRK
jgi:hypothetical protein